MTMTEYALVRDGAIQRVGPHPGYLDGQTGLPLTDEQLVAHGFLRVHDEPPAIGPGERLARRPWPAWAIEPDRVLITYHVLQIPFEELRAAALARINGGYTARTVQLAADYPEDEQKSWPVQIQEANAVLAGEDVPTPWIDAAAPARGISRQELAGLIRAQDLAYRTYHGALTGVRQALRDRINAVPDDEHAAAAFVAIEWPDDEPPGEIEPDTDPT